MINDTNDQSGIVGMLVGLIVLVFAGVGFSLLIDKRTKHSSSKVTTGEIVEREAQVIRELKDELDAKQARWERVSRPIEGQDEELAAWSAKTASSEDRLPALREKLETVEAELGSATAEFRDYRSRYRAQVRAAAAGEKHEELTTASGKVYHGVTIRRVTSAGIEMVHKNGITRLLPKDLNADLRNRFQWDQEEVEAVLMRERAREESHRKAVAKFHQKDRRTGKKPSTKPSKKKAEKSADAENLALLRDELIHARSLLVEAESAHSNASTQAQNGRGRSVPGSLETWAEKTRRLQVISRNCRKNYERARSRLAAVSPRDSLLRANAVD